MTSQTIKRVEFVDHNYHTTDEEYAARLQQQYNNEANASAPPISPTMSPPPGRNQDYMSNRYGTVVPGLMYVGTGSTSASSDEDDDEIRRQHQADVALARKLQQQLQDEEFARRIQQEEHDAAEARNLQRRRVTGVVVTGESNNTREPPRRRSCCVCVSRFMSCFICMVVLIIVGVVLYTYLGHGNFYIPGTNINVGNLGNVITHDPWEYGPHQNATLPQTYWRVKQKEGLSMTILNALTPEWYDHFNAAISDWDNGTPDALTLTTQIVDADPNCEPVSGAIKVCNAQYGMTGWKGINEVLVTQRGYITVSVAKMNESYLTGKYRNSDNERRYTLCHEVGHGFGLNHADESFTNRDLGTCMDYTNYPEHNLTPNSQNYETLVELYGTVPGTTNLNTDDSVAAQASTSAVNTGVFSTEAMPQQDATTTQPQNTHHKSKGGGGRQRRANLRKASSFDSRLSSSSHPKFTSFTDETEQGRARLWQLIHFEDGKQVHMRRLEGGYVVMAHVLLA